MTGSLSSLVSAANLSMFSFSIVYVCSAQPELASPKAKLAFAKQRLATEGDWLALVALLPGTNFAGLASDLEVVFIPAKRALRPRMLLRASRPGEASLAYDLNSRCGRIPLR